MTGEQRVITEGSGNLARFTPLKRMALLETNFAAGLLQGCVSDMVIVRHKRGLKIVRRRRVRPLG
jgi:hypothetical protein